VRWTPIFGQREAKISYGGRGREEKSRMKLRGARKGAEAARNQSLASQILDTGIGTQE
jgi:hypothetical protein